VEFLAFPKFDDDEIRFLLPDGGEILFSPPSRDGIYPDGGEILFSPPSRDGVYPDGGEMRLLPPDGGEIRFINVELCPSETLVLFELNSEIYLLCIPRDDCSPPAEINIFRLSLSAKLRFNTLLGVKDCALLFRFVCPPLFCPGLELP
jgi:hypothetical protein